MICVLEGLNSFLYLCFVVSRWSRPHRHSGGSSDSHHRWHCPVQPWEHLYCRGGWNSCEWSHKSGWLISPALWVHLCARPTVPKESWAYIHIYPKSCDGSWGQQTTERASPNAEEWFVQWVNHSEWTICWREYWGRFFTSDLIHWLLKNKYHNIVVLLKVYALNNLCETTVQFMHYTCLMFCYLMPALPDVTWCCQLKYGTVETRTFWFFCCCFFAFFKLQ